MSSSKVGVTYYVRAYRKGVIPIRTKELAFSNYAESILFFNQTREIAYWNCYEDIRLEREVHSHKVPKKRKP